jgi:hypothetical protein
METPRKTNKKSNKKQITDRMRTAYHKNQDKMNDDAPNRSDSIARQKKLDDLEHRSRGKISWRGLREIITQRQEQYDYKQPKINPYKNYTLSQIYDRLEKSTAKELSELIQAFDVECIDDLYELINKFFTLLEQ